MPHQPGALRLGTGGASAEAEKGDLISFPFCGEKRGDRLWRVTRQG